MAKKRAEIEASLVGGQQVKNEAQSIAGTFQKTAQSIQNGLGASFRSVGGALASVVSGGLQAAGVFQSINLAGAVTQAKQLDAVTARLGQSAGVAGSTLKATFEATEGKTLTSAVAMAEVAKSLGRVTYDGKFAAESLQALGDDALAVGRELPDQLPLAAALHGLGVQSKDLQGELGRLTDIADRLKLVGGPTALKDTIAGLGPQLAGVAADSDQARAKLEALVGVMSKGLKPERAREVSAGVLNAIKSRALEFERITGRRVLDDNGQVQDPTEILRALKANTDKRFGKGNSAAKRRALMAEGELGFALMRMDFGEVDRIAASARDTGATAKAAEAFRQSKEGQREAAKLAAEQNLRHTAEPLVDLSDKANNALGPWGMLGLNLFGSTLIGGGLKFGGKALADTAGKGLAALGGGTSAAAGLVTASFAAPAIGVLADIGEKTEVTGAKYLNKHADIAGEGLARRAMREGDSTAAFMASKGDREILQATLLSLEKMLAAQQEGNDILRNQVAAGIAAEFRRAPIYARTETEAPQ